MRELIRLLADQFFQTENALERDLIDQLLRHYEKRQMWGTESYREANEKKEVIDDGV